MTSATTDRRQGLNAGAAIKVACRAATTANITLSGEQTIDGVAVVTGDRVLVKNQTSGVNNGIYEADSGTWTRTLDADGPYDFKAGSLVFVINGTAAAGYWYLTTTGDIIPGTTSLTFAAASTALAVISAYMQTLIDDTTAAAARATLLIETKSTVASVAGATADIWTGTGHLIDYTGTNTATGFAAAPQAGAARELLCAAACSFTSGANFVVAGFNSNTFTAAAGDRILVVAKTTTVHLLYPLKASGGVLLSDAVARRMKNVGMNVDIIAGTVEIALDSASNSSGSSVWSIAFGTGSADNKGATDGSSAAVTNLIIPQTATLGTVSGQPSRIWVALIYVAGAMELAVMNALNGTSIVPINENTTISTTTISTGSDSAGVWYSTTARASVPFVVLGYFESTQATAGDWQTTASGSAVNPIQRPGDIVQSVPYQLGTVVTGTDQIPYDDSIPQAGEGAIMMTHPGITPTFASNVLAVEHSGSYCMGTGADNLTVYIAKTGAAALAAIGVYPRSNDNAENISIKHTLLAAVTSSIVFEVRAGTATTYAVGLNGLSGGTQRYGGVAAAYLNAKEYFA